MKNRVKLLPIIALLITMLWSACTTQKDGFSYRVFHNTTAKFNGFFYSKESMKEAHAILKENQVEDYDEILPVFIYGDEETSKTVYSQMERTIEKSTNVIDRHKMDVSERNSKKMKRPVKNKWIDENYLLIGQGYFYKQNYFKAEEFFLFVNRKYKEPLSQARGFTWLARVYIEREEWIKANNNLIKAIQEKKVEDDEAKADMYLVYADYYIRQEKYKDAIEKLERAITYIKKKKDRARPTFILAQLKQKLGKSQEAIDTYERVLKLRPEYEMEFYARINQALAFSRRGGNPAEIRKTLFKMLKDDKNIEYRDQIYYALADLSLEERKRDEGIDYLYKSIEANTDNVKQKAKTYLRLADLFFDDRVYENAQAYYDSTYQNINEEHKRYVEIKNMAESLTELVVNLNIIDREDSLQSFCDLDEDALQKRLKEVQKQIEYELEQKRIEEEERLANADEGAEAGAAGTAMFWPWNNMLKQKGYTFFHDYWGDRKLEDNWRRRNKFSVTFTEDEEEVEQEEVAVFEEKVFDEVPTIDELMADLPCNPAAMDSSNSSLAGAYYNAGVIYKEKLEDFENAVESWEVLTTRFDDSDYHPTTYYQLYRAYLKKEQDGYVNIGGCGTCSSKYWGDVISQKYPGSEWDKLVHDPSYLEGKELKEADEEEAYVAMYNKYSRKQYIDVISACNEIIIAEPDNHLICKYRILKAQSIGNMDGLTGQRDNYLKELESVISECPDTEEAARATEILDFLNGKVSVATDEKADSIKADLFKYNASSKHYFAISFATDKGNINKIKATVSDFNMMFFKSSTLKTTSNLLGKERHVVLVKTFTNIPEAQNYHKTFLADKEIVKDLNEAGHDLFLISKENYLTLFKSKEYEQYLEFFNENYSE